MRSTRCSCFFALAALITRPPVATAHTPSETARVALGDEDSGVRYALTHNPELRTAHWDQDIASAAVSRASALSNPVARGEWLHVQAPENYGWGVGLEWAPPQPGVYGSGKDAARAGVRAVKADFNERAADLEASVRQGYALIGALAEEISLVEKSLETRRAVQQAIGERVSHGAASRIDLSVAALSLAREEQVHARLLLTRQSEITRLEALLGLSEDQSLDALPLTKMSDATAPVPGAGATRALEQKALGQRHQLQADAARADAADAILAAEQGKRWPWLALQARFRRRDQSSYANDVTLGLEVTLPIFDRNPGPIAAAEASRRAARDVEFSHRAAIVRNVRALHAESVGRRELAEHYAQAIAPVLADHAALIKQALAGRELDLTALLAAEDLVTQGGIEYLEARLAQRKSEIALARALGEYPKAAAVVGK